MYCVYLSFSSGVVAYCSSVSTSFRTVSARKVYSESWNSPSSLFKEYASLLLMRGRLSSVLVQASASLRHLVANLTSIYDLKTFAMGSFFRLGGCRLRTSLRK